MRSGREEQYNIPVLNKADFIRYSGGRPNSPSKRSVGIRPISTDGGPGIIRRYIRSPTGAATDSRRRSNPVIGPVGMLEAEGAVVMR